MSPLVIGYLICKVTSVEGNYDLESVYVNGALRGTDNTLLLCTSNKHSCIFNLKAEVNLPFSGQTATIHYAPKTEFKKEKRELHNAISYNMIIHFTMACFLHAL